MKHFARFQRKALKFHKHYAHRVRKTARRIVAHPHFHKALWVTAGVTVFASALYVSNNAMQVVAQTFQGPSGSAGTGSGALGLDANKNLSLGTSTPVADTKLLIVASSSQSAGFAMKVVQPGASTTNANDGLVPGNVLFMIRNDGKIGIGGPVGASTNTVVIAGNTFVNGTVTATGFTGGLTGQVSAGNVGSGLFGQYAGGGNYSFPANLSVATSTAPSAGVLFVNGGAGIGTASPGYKLEVRDSVDIQARLSSPDSWAGLSFSDSSGNDQIYYNGQNSTFAIGGGGSNVSGKKLHVDGGMSVGATYDSSSTPSNGLVVEGIGRFAGTNAFSVGEDAGYYRIQANTSQTGFAFLTSGNSYAGLKARTLSIGSTYGDTAAPTNGAIIEGNVGIGTTAPSSTIHAVGGTAMTGSWNRTAVLQATYPVIVFNSNSTKWGGIGYDHSVGNGTMRFWVNAGSYDAVTGTNVLSLDSSGATVNGHLTMAAGNNLMVGTTTAADFVSIAKQGTGGIRMTNSSNAVISEWVNNTASVSIGARTNHSLSLNTNNATALSLDTSGNAAITGNLTVGGGTGKINAGTIDPIYTINGVNYATYVSGMIGVKEEISGTVSLGCAAEACEAVLDLKGAPKGSDLWLFGKTIAWQKHLKDAAVLLTPSFDGRVWYDKDIASGRIVIRATRPEGGKAEVSYRLTAPRFDSEKWSNYNNDPGTKGFIIND